MRAELRAGFGENCSSLPSGNYFFGGRVKHVAILGLVNIFIPNL